MAENPKGSEVKMTHATMKVLKCFLGQPRAELSGADITKTTKVFTGTLYPILLRLEAAGWLTSHWENIDPKEEGRPRRRYYRLTATGQRLATEAFNELGFVDGRLAWES
jgi:PadR family transcriptional regulator, regulatory protein PadR